MDGKYAKYIPSSHGFITKLEIVDDVLHVYTKETTKGKPNKYPLREKIGEYSERLENQYRLITEEDNLQIIKNDLANDSRKILNDILLILSLPVILTSVILAFVTSAPTPFIIGMIIESILMAGHAITLNGILKNFDNEIDMIRTYIYCRNNIERTLKKDPNITNNLKSSTMSRIDSNIELNKNNLIPEIFDITLLDDLISKTTSKKELKQLLTNYMICNGLRQPQVFVNPNEEQLKALEAKNAHKKVRKPESK